MDTINNKAEVIHAIDFFSTVGEELCDIFESRKIPLEVFYDLIGYKKPPKEIVKLTKSEMKKISQYFEDSNLLQYLEDFQKKYIISKKRSLDNYKQNINVFRKLKSVCPLVTPEFDNGIDVYEDICDFLEIETDSNVISEIDKGVALFKISNFEPDRISLFGWLKRGEHDFKKLALNEYDEQALLAWVNNKEWKSKINSPEYFLGLPELFKSFGVGLVYTPFLPKTVYGAVRWFSGKPLIQVSDRDKCLATAWYTLLHEIGHIILHKEVSEIIEGSIDMTKTQHNKVEQEANTFAAEHLFQGDLLRKIIFGSQQNKSVAPEFISNMAKDQGISPMLIAFWMKKANTKSQNRHLFLPKLDFNYLK